jgi:hypothetical protein
MAEVLPIGRIVSVHRHASLDPTVQFETRRGRNRVLRCHPIDAHAERDERKRTEFSLCKPNKYRSCASHSN